MKIRTKRKPVAEMNVVPYIDVMLVLLIIFMVTAPLLVQGVDVDIPKVASAPLPIDERSEYLIIALLEDGTLLIERGDEEPQQATPDVLAGFVNGALASNPELKVMLRADQAVAYGEVMSVMSGLQRGGIESVGLITEAPDERQ